MAFNKKTWVDRDSEHPNRRTLTNINDATDVKTYDISRAEGEVTTQGTPLTAFTMNDLETRIASAFTGVEANMPEANPSEDATDDLTKLKVGGTVYGISGGGASDDTYEIGLQVDFENSTFTRLGDAVGKSSGGDFNKFPMYGGRMRVNVLDDGSIVAKYGDDSFKEDGTNGQVMVYQPKFYYRVEALKIDPQNTGIGYHLRKANYWVSNTKGVGYKIHPAFIDASGNEIDYVLMGAYEACLYDASASAYITNDAQVMAVSEDKLSSIAGVKPASGSTQQFTRPNVETLAQNRGANWHGSTVKIASMNQLLCMIEMGTMDFQTAIGQGVVSYASGNEPSNTGSTSSLGNGTGQATETIHISSDGTETTDTTAGKLSVSYRGLENPWGNIWEFEYGVNIWGNGNMAGGEPYVADDFNFAESKRTDNYEGAGFTLTNASGYISAFGYSTRCDWLFMASECAGNSSLPVGDYTYVTPNLNAYMIAPFGGGWANGARAGGFCWDLDLSVGYRGRTIGGRLVYVPTSKSGIQSITLKASDWDDNTITVSVAGVTASSTQEILPLQATSEANISNNKALQSANIMDYGQAEGEITLYAENTPSTDLQIRVLVRA